MCKLRILLILSTVIVGLIATTAIASANDHNAFLCPVVGDGVLVAAAHGGVEPITPPVGTSLLPGNNQAGANSNANAHNTLGPGNVNAGPGHNPDFSPIWPATP